ncbi:putative F-box protein [Cardamine amara subsp. amara]|uniref:F-box protein n=1 Tax=Cardamine amara subsp. amara TaxID=228776 RepID=A0ABD1BYW6_CARAN
MKRQQNYWLNRRNGRKIIRRNKQSSASTYIGVTVTLPIDLIIEILLRLPAKSIANFRCVSKQWSSIIRRPNFTESFSKNSLSRPRLLFTFRIVSKWHFFSSPQPRINFDEKSVVATDYRMGYSRGQLIRMKIWQSVHGFIYLNYVARCKGKIDEVINVICNPCTGQHIYLPQVKGNNYYLRCFFGYDPIGKQFKVLCRTQNLFEHYQVLTLGTRELSWRKIECSFRHCPKKENNNGICINGVIYYKALINNSSSTIVCFDVRSEKFSFIEIEKARPLNLINYKGKLGVLLCFDYGSSLAEVWVLDDAKKVKWSKHTIVLLNPARKPINSIWATDMGEIAWASSRWTNPLYVYYYHLERQSVRRVEIKEIKDKVLIGGDHDHPNNFFAFTNHVENLMFL